MSKRTPLRGLLLLGASCVALSAAPALAQNAPSSGTTIEEIVVTAEKREQSLQDVPVAVTAYTSERREVLGVNTVEDLARMTPSLSYTNNDRLSIRGFGRLTNSIGTDPSVALYSDGIFSNSMADASTPPLFIERTEVLRGPQGTLYGRNSIGGTMNVISKRPTEDFQGEVRGLVGNYESWRLDGLVRGPIAENLRFLVGGSIERRNQGFIENIGPARDTGELARYMIEVQLEADLGENTLARLRYSKFDWDDSYGVGNTLNSIITPYDTTSFVGTGTSALYYNTTLGFTGVNPAVQDPYTINVNWGAYGSLDNHHRLHLDITHDLGWATLKYLGGYQQYDYNTSSDSDYSNRAGPQNLSVPDLDGPGPLTAFTATNVATDARTFYEERQSWYSNELNLSSNSDGPLNWIVGVFQYYQEYDQPQGIRVVGDPGMFNPISLAGGSVPENPRGAFLYVDGHLETKSYAAFGQVDYEFAPTWTLTAGLRYTYDQKDGHDIARYVARVPSAALLTGLVGAGLPISVAQGLSLDLTTQQVCGGFTVASCAANPLTADLFANPGGGLRRNLSGDWDAWTGTLGVQWQPEGDTNLYARYSRGYKSGGWLGSNGLTPDPIVEPEYVDSFEIGAKKTFGGVFQLNAAAFYSDYRGFQVPLTVPLGTITGTRFLNLDAEVSGIELEGQWSPIDNLQLYGNYAYLNAKVAEGCCFVDQADPRALAPGARPTGPALANGNQPQTLVDNRLPLSPEHKFTVGGNYTWDFNAGSLTANGSYTWTGDQQSTIFANPIYESPQNEIADFRLLWRDVDDRYTLIAFVKNAFDEVAYQSSTATSPSAVGPRRTVILNFPRTFGAEVHFRF
jgi:iron complex outermembrane receptor protein